MRGGLTMTAVAPAAFACAAVADAGARAFGGRAGDDANAAVDVARHDLEDALPLRSSSRATSPVTPSAVTPLTPGANEQIDDAPQAGVVDIACRRERRRENRIHAFELHASSFLERMALHTVDCRPPTRLSTATVDRRPRLSTATVDQRLPTADCLVLIVDQVPANVIAGPRV